MYSSLQITALCNDKLQFPFSRNSGELNRVSSECTASRAHSVYTQHISHHLHRLTGHRSSAECSSSNSFDSETNSLTYVSLFPLLTSTTEVKRGQFIQLVIWNQAVRLQCSWPHWSSRRCCSFPIEPHHVYPAHAFLCGALHLPAYLLWCSSSQLPKAAQQEKQSSRDAVVLNA